MRFANLKFNGGGCEFQKGEKCTINGDKMACPIFCNRCTFFSPTRDSIKKNIVEGYRKNKSEIASLKDTVNDYSRTLTRIRAELDSYKKSHEKQDNLIKMQNELIEKSQGFIDRLLYFTKSTKNKTFEEFITSEGYELPKDEEQKGEEKTE